MVESVEKLEQNEEKPIHRRGIGSPVEYDRAWLGSFLRPLLIAVLAACVALALLSFVRISISPLTATYVRLMILVSIGASLLGSFSTTWLAQPEQRTQRNTGYRTAEIFLLILLARLIGWSALGGWPGFDLFFTRPLEVLFDGPFILGLFVIGIAWGMSTTMTDELLRMGLQPDELAASEMKLSRHELDQTPPNYTDRRAVLNGFVNKWMLGGVFLVLLSAGSRLAPVESGFFAITNQNIDPTVISAVVIYFLAGLVLISTGQLAVLRARWTLEKVTSQESVLRNWPMYTLLLIVGIAFLAIFLPFGGTFYLAQILSAIIQFIYLAIVTFVQLVFGIIFAIFGVFGGEGEAPPALEPPPPMDFSAFGEAEPEGAELPPWLGGSIFWGITALLFGYAAYIYFSGRGLNLAWFQRIWQLIRTRWNELFGTYQEWRSAQIARKAAEKESGSSSLLGGIGSWLRLRNLNPDQQVRYFYLTTLHRAEKAGLPRQRGETPTQYAPRLMQKLGEDLEAPEHKEAAKETAPANALSDAEIAAQKRENVQAVQGLTDAFVRQRYGGHASLPDELPALKRLWEQVKRRLGFLIRGA